MKFWFGENFTQHFYEREHPIMISNYLTLPVIE